MYRVSKPRGNLSNITITNEETTSSVVLGRYNTTHKEIFDKYGYGIITPASIDEWDFEVNEDAGKELAMSCFTGHRPARTKITKSEQKTSDESNIKPENESNESNESNKSKKFSAYDYLFGYTDEIE